MLFKKRAKGKNRKIFGNMKIGKKLVLTFILVALISSAGGITGYLVLTNTVGQYSGALLDYGFSQGDVGLCNAEFNHDCILLRDLIIQTDSADKQKMKQQIDQSTAKLTQYLTKIKPEMVTDREKEYYDTIKDNLNDFIPAQDQTVRMALADNSSDAYATLAQSAPLADQVSSAINALVEEKTKTGSQVSANLSREGAVAKGIILCIIALSTFLSIVIAWVISHGISRPVGKLVQVSKKMAQGDLSAKIEIGTKDEIGQLAAAFAEMAGILNMYISDIGDKLARVEKGDLTVSRGFEYKGDFAELIGSVEGIVQFMNHTVTGMRETSQQVASGSGQMSSGAQALAQGAAEQASSIEELSASIAEITSQIQENAKQVTRASADVDDVSAEIETCGRHMQRMVGAMSKIHNSSSGIEKIIRAIEDIAFQTNILALNAAVEAARAGDAGKGFAVVADEVRNLASKSSAAAKDTTKLIRDSIDEVENGTEIAGETAKSLQRVVERAKAVSGTVGRISQATAKQSDAIQQINIGIEQISRVVQTNSATAEESAAASEELSGQARAMESLAEKFRLRPESETL